MRRNMKKLFLCFSLIVGISLFTLPVISASSNELKDYSVKDCTPACDYTSSDSYHSYIMRNTAVTSGRDIRASASTSANKIKFKVTAIAGNISSVESGTNVRAVAHVGLYDENQNTHNSIIQYT